MRRVGSVDDGGLPRLRARIQERAGRKQRAGVLEKLDAINQEVYEKEAAKEAKGPLGGAWGAMLQVDRMANMFKGASAGAKRQIDMIEGYPIPNSKEDILEFVLLASTRYKGIKKPLIAHAEPEKMEAFNLDNAWRVKCEQAYDKAKLTMASDKETLAQLAKVLRDKHIPVTEKEKKAAKIAAGLRTPLFLLIVFLLPFGLIGLGIAAIGSEAKETKRLTKTVLQVERLIEKEDWAGAYEKANEIEWRFEIDDSDAGIAGIFLSKKIKDPEKVAEWEAERKALLSEIEAGKAAGRKAKDE